MNTSEIMSDVEGIAAGGAKSLLGGIWVYALVAALAFGAGGAAAWKAQDVIYGKQVAELQTSIANEKTAHAEDLRRVSNAAAAAAADALAKQRDLEATIAGLDDKYWKDIQNASAENEQLRAAVRAGTLRLRLNARSAGGADTAGGNGVPVTAGGASLGNGEAGAELDKSDSETLLGIAGDGDKAIVKLTACQSILAAERHGASGGIAMPADAGGLPLSQR